MTFRLSDGMHVAVFRVGTETEFVTTDPRGEVIATVRKAGAEAARLVKDLRVAERLAAL